MQQIVDLQNSATFGKLDVQLISIAKDSVTDMAVEVNTMDIDTVPVLSDPDLDVSAAYDVLQWAMDNGEPSHTFVLLDGEGKIIWVKDYGAPDNPNRTMYVEVSELVRLIKTNLAD